MARRKSLTFELEAHHLETAAQIAFGPAGLALLDHCLDEASERLAMQGIVTVEFLVDHPADIVDRSSFGRHALRFTQHGAIDAMNLGLGEVYCRGKGLVPCPAAEA